MNKQTLHDLIIDYLVSNNEVFKDDLLYLTAQKKSLLDSELPEYYKDIQSEYEVRLKQHIAFKAGKDLALPVEYIIIELENINLEEYLNV